ncbi:MAG: hypothetical protein Q4F34_01555 [Prevotellaceae bacterium]|nr:hypothetical protein [Prevotellaceae bacterium]
MAITFSVSRIRDPRTNNGVTKIYPRAQTTETVALDAVAEYAARHYGLTLDENTIRGAVSALQKSVVDILSDGKRVSLGSLGTFAYHIKSKGMSPSECTTNGFMASRNIDDVTVRWIPNEAMKSLMRGRDVHFKQLTTRRMRRLALKASSTNELVVRL